MKNFLAFMLLLIGMFILSPPGQQVQAAPQKGVCLTIDLPARAIAPALLIDDDSGGTTTVEETDTGTEVEKTDSNSIFEFFKSNWGLIATILWLLSELIASSKLKANSIYQLATNWLKSKATYLKT